MHSTSAIGPKDLKSSVNFSSVQLYGKLRINKPEKNIILQKIRNDAMK